MKVLLYVYKNTIIQDTRLVALSSCGFSGYSGYPNVPMTTCSAIQDLPLFLFAPKTGIYNKNVIILSCCYYLIYKIEL